MTHPVHRQRAALCDLLESLSEKQFNAETLCEGWDAGDVAAHLLVREREPIPAIGILFKPLSGLNDKRIAARRADGREKLVADLRKGPTPWFLAPVARDVQVSEDWIHTEDIARGGAADVEGATPPSSDGTEDPQVAALLWKAVGRFAPMTLRGARAKGVVTLTDGTTTRTYRVGSGAAKAAKGATPDATITGPVGELLLYVTGRTAARVSFDGDQPLIDALKATSKGV